MPSKRDRKERRPRSIALIEKRVKKWRRRYEGEGYPSVMKVPVGWLDMIKCRNCNHLKDGEDWCRIKKSHVLNMHRDRMCNDFTPKEELKE